MTRQLTAKSNLETLKKDAKRWLKALRAGDPAARSRLVASWPKAAAEPGLRDIQQALAREYGMADWGSLKAALEDLTLDRKSRAERAQIVLRSAWDGDRSAAARIVARDPQIAHESVHLAAICGDLSEVRRRLAQAPDTAKVKAGPRDGDPLLYLAYGRVPGAGEYAVEIARLLIDHGADPRAEFDDGWGNPFTVLTGVIGRGEGAGPSHSRADDLAELLIAAGGDPFDTQALYNTSIVEDDPHWLEILHGHCERQGTAGRWRQVGRGLGGNVKQCTVDYLLGNAVSSGHLRRSAWLLAHGANSNSVNAYSGLAHLKVARLAGLTDMAELLLRNGADNVPLLGYDGFQTACLAGDRATAEQLLAKDPSHLFRFEALHTAGVRGLIGPLGLLLDLGVDPNLVDKQGVSALHQAAGFGGAAAVQLLVDHGAAIDPRERRYGATPLGWAVHMGMPDAVTLLTPLSSDPGALASIGALDRLAAVLIANPTAIGPEPTRAGATPLHNLPDNADLALSVAAFLLAQGADAKVTDNQGLTAEQVARKRGLDEAADLIGGHHG